MAGRWTNILKNKWTKRIGGTVVCGAAVTTLAVSFAVTPAYASDLIAHPPKLPWYHHGLTHSYDHAAIRRGYQVYKEVCAACHSMKFLCYRHLVGVCFTEEEAKREAAEITVLDGPNDEGLMYDRPGRLADKFPKPYANKELARMANNGSYPPDLSLVVKAREEGEDYIFQILTGYCDPPPGRKLDEGQHYNPYFPGGGISMAQALYNEIIEYPDGTPATTSQLAKDVITFLTWAGDPHLEDRKRFAPRFFLTIGVLFAMVFYIRNLKFSYLKNIKCAFTSKRYKKEL